MVTTVHKWRPYLLGMPFIIKTNRQSLKYILEQRIATPSQQKWLTKLLWYLFMVEYKQGCENKVADALSRRTEPDLVLEDAPVLNTSMHSPCLCLISFPSSSWIEELKASYQSSTKMQQLLHQLQSGSACPTFFSLHNGLFLYKGRVYLDSHNSLKSKVLHLVHDSPLGGHSGFLESFHRLKQDFFWVGMKSNLKLHIRECGVC